MSLPGTETSAQRAAFAARRFCGSRAAGGILLAALLTLGVPARAQGPVLVNVSVDASAVGVPLERIWPFYGYDEINYTTSPEGQALLGILAAANTAPVRVRSHFLLNTGDGVPALKWGSTNVYSEDAAGNPSYSWSLTDGIMDSITQAGAFPFVELGFMPEALSSHPTPYRNSSSMMLDGGCYYPPTDYTKWAALIHEWAQHANARYPDVGVNWLWELWNEPDIGYWQGSVDDYAKLYDYTESALHEVLPSAPLGGPAVAIAAGSFLKTFLQHCATGLNAVTGKTGTRLDHVTFHAKGGVTISGDHVQMGLGNQLRIHRFGFSAVASFPEFKQTPIYITEADPDGCAACPATSTPADAYRNSTAYGAYELAMMKRSLELEAKAGVKLGGLLTWAFTFPGTPYFAGYRALTTNGINLPVLGAFKLLGRLNGTRLPLDSSGAHPLEDVLTDGVRDQPDVDGMATLDGDTIQVLLWNYHDDLVTVAPTPMHVAIKVPASLGPYAHISHLRVDEAHGDAYSVWVSQGAPAAPTARQIAALREAMDPSPLLPDRSVAVAADRSLELDFDLPRFGVSLVTIRPATGVNEGSAGTDGGGSTSASAQSSGCACRVGRHANNANDWAALLGLGVLVLAGTARGARRALPRARKPGDTAELACTVTFAHDRIRHVASIVRGRAATPPLPHARKSAHLFGPRR